MVVTIHLVSARTGSVEEIGRMHIFNERFHSSRRADYGVKVMRRGTKDKVQRTGEVSNWPRQSYNVWRLVLRALMSAFPEERG